MLSNSLRADRFLPVDSVGRYLVVAGLLIAAVGLVLWLGSGKWRGGLLPGDLVIDRGGVKFHLPIVTCLVVSALLTFLLWLFRK